jgi:hypothetical protein
MYERVINAFSEVDLLNFVDSQSTINTKYIESRLESIYRRPVL